MSATRLLAKPLAVASLMIAVAPAAPAGQVVNVYSERQPVFLEKVFSRFAEQTGIKVETLFAKDGLVERIKLEGDSSPADLIMVADVGRLDLLKQEGVTQSVQDDLLLGNIPSVYRDPEGHWFGVTRRARILFVHKDSPLAGQPAPTYERLGSGNLGGTVCMRVGKHPYNIALIAAYLVHHGGQRTENWLRGLEGSLGRKPQGNDRAQIAAVANGECDYAVANSYYYYKMINDPSQKATAEQVVPLFPKFERGGTHINLSGYAMARHAPNRGNALELMRFLTGADAQLLYAEENGEFPVRDELGSGGLSGMIERLDPDGISVGDIASRRAQASELVAKTGFGE
jgi:iron(III) transport system substrate-binding protein